MPITITDLRQFAGNDRMLLDAQTGTIKSVNKWQRFKSFCNIGDARRRNIDTLSAIQHAFLNDTRFEGKSLQAELARLLGQVRTDRAIGAAQIRSILDTMDRLADSKDGVLARTEARLAAQGLPDFARGIEAQVVEFVKEQATLGIGFGNIDVPARIRTTLAFLNTVFSHAGNDPDLRAVLAHGSVLNALQRGNDGSPAFTQTVQRRVDAFRAPVAHIVAAAAASPDPAAAKRAGIELLGGLAKPVDPAVIGAVAAHSARLSIAPFAALRTGANKNDIVQAAIAVGRELSTREIEWPEGVRPPSSSDRETQAFLRRFALQNAVMALPTDVRRRLLDILESPEGCAAARYVYIDGGRLQSHQNDINAIAWTAEILQLESGRPDGYPGGFPRRNELVADLAGLSPLSRCAYVPKNALSGDAMDEARLHLLAPSGFQDVPDPAAAFHAKIDAGVSDRLSVSFAAEMKRLATGEPGPAFNRAERRATAIILPDGTRLTDSPAQTREAIARLVTGIPDADYDALPPADRTRTNVLLALLSPASDVALESGIPMSLNDNGVPAVTGRPRDGSPRVRHHAFRIAGSPAKGFTVNVRLLIPVDEVTAGRGLVVNTHALKPDEGSFDYEMEVRLDPATLDRAAALDWSGYDGTAADAVLANPDQPHPDRLADARRAVPDAYRFDLGVAAGFHFHGDRAEPSPVGA